MTDILKPSHAITIWSSKEILYVELPQASGEGNKTHILKLPLNVWGLTQLLNTLKARSQTSRLAEKGDPTQFQADREIAEMSRKAAGYTGPIKKEIKVPLSEKLKTNLKDVVRRYITS